MFAQLTESGLTLIDELIESHFKFEAKLLESSEEDEMHNAIDFLKNLEEYMTVRFYG